MSIVIVRPIGKVKKLFSGHLTISSQTFSDAYENSNTTEYKELASRVSKQVRWLLFFLMFSFFEKQNKTPTSLKFIGVILTYLKTLHYSTLSFSSKLCTVKWTCCPGTMWDPVCKVSGNLNNSATHERKLWVIGMKGQSERSLLIFYFSIVIMMTLYDLILNWQTAWNICSLKMSLSHCRTI